MKYAIISELYEEIAHLKSLCSTGPYPMEAHDFDSIETVYKMLLSSHEPDEVYEVKRIHNATTIEPSRTMIAAMAMQGMIASFERNLQLVISNSKSSGWKVIYPPETVAEHSAKYADALLLELAKPVAQ